MRIESSHTMGMRAHVATLTPAERAATARQHGAGREVARDVDMWEVAADMGVSVSELMAELAAERAMFERVGNSDRRALEVGHRDARTLGETLTAKRATRAALASDAATVGRAMLASYGHRTDVVVTVHNGKASLGRAVATGTPAAAAKRAKLAHETLCTAAASLATAVQAERAACAGKLVPAIAAAARRADRLAARQESAAAAHTVALAQHMVAALWEDVPECRAEIVVPAEPEFFQTHAAPADRVPVRYIEQLRVKPNHGVSDPTGELAMRSISDELAARDRAERRLAARVAPAAVAVAAVADKSATNAAYKARRAAAARDRRARAHS